MIVINPEGIKEDTPTVIFLVIFYAHMIPRIPQCFPAHWKKTCQNISNCYKQDLIRSFYYVLDLSKEEVKYLVPNLPCCTN